MSSTKSRKPWFGPKRFGFGISPQTWQGWVVVLVVALAIVVLARVLAG